MCNVVGLSSLSKVKKFLFFFLSRKGGRGCVFAVFLPPVPEKEILDFIAHGSIIQVFTVDGCFHSVPPPLASSDPMLPPCIPDATPSNTDRLTMKHELH